MTPRPSSRPPRRLVGLVALAALALSACTGPITTPTPTATTPTSATQGDPDGTCANPRQTYDALSPLPAAGQVPADTIVSAIKDRGRIVVGIVGDVQLMSARNAETGAYEGFDVDLYRALARQLFGADDRYEIRVITPNGAIDALRNQDVDLVVQGYTMTCGRWIAVGFSSEYLRVKQRVAVAKGSGLGNPAALNGHPVCIVAGTPDRRAVEAFGGRVVTRDTLSGCLSAFQSGTVDGVSAAAPALAGLAQQDPYLQVLGDDLGEQSVGVGVKADRVVLAQWVSAVIAARAANGQWQASYDKWLAPSLGAAQPPAPTYGRRA